jgi:hypothetical protein
VVFLFSSFFPSLSLFPSGQRKISQGQAAWRSRGLSSTGGFPLGPSDLVSSLMSGREGEKQERKTTDPFSSLRWRLEGTERLCLSGENGEEQAPLLSREEQGWTAAARWWQSLLCSCGRVQQNKRGSNSSLWSGSVSPSGLSFSSVTSSQLPA